MQEQITKTKREIESTKLFEWYGRRQDDGRQAIVRCCHPGDVRRRDFLPVTRLYIVCYNS